MQSFLRLLLVALALVATMAANAVPDVTELKIDTTFKPSTCTLKSSRGDKLSMHYDGTRADPALGDLVACHRQRLSHLASGTVEVAPNSYSLLAEIDSQAV